MIVTAPAKINLYLEVLSKRKDGYHEIETLFERVSISDRISVELVQDRSSPGQAGTATTITCDDPAIPAGEESLMRQVVDVFNQKIGMDLAFKVVLEKRIPVGAGLGGGSSDAAALLKALNEITGFPLDMDALFSISRKLGSDIPFFLSGASFARGKGRGDIIQKVETRLKMWHLIVSPPFEASTREIYSRFPGFGLTKDRPLDKIFTAFLLAEDVKGITKNLHNSLQEITLRKFPVLKKVLFELKKAGAKAALLCGSGGAVFGVFEPERIEPAREKLVKIFPVEEDWKVLAAHTC